MRKSIEKLLKKGKIIFNFNFLGIFNIQYILEKAMN